MNIKQLKKRVLLGLIEPELFKMPIKKEEDIPLIFDIYVHEDGKFIRCFNTCVSNQYLLNYSGSTVYIYYQPKNSEGVYITPETHPNLFHTTPFIDTDPSSPTSQIISKFSTLLTSFSEPYLEVDWGDGNITRTTARDDRNITIDGEKYTFSQIKPVDEDNTFTIGDMWYHKYEKSGRYTVKVKGNVARFYFENYPVQINTTINSQQVGKCNLLKIHQWGDLHVKDLCYMFSFLLNGSEKNLVNKSTFEGYPEINWEQYRNVVSIASMFYNESSMTDYRSELAYIPKNEITWELVGGDRFFDKFPNIISASHCFYNNYFDYIPQECFKNNPYLVQLNNTFYRYADKPFKYIGKNACKDLHYLQQASYCFYSTSDSENEYLQGVEIIEDSVFENCYRLDSKQSGSTYLHHPFGMGVQYCLKTVGNRIFANCYHLTDAQYMFQDCYLLSKIGNEIFENCHSLKNISGMFINCGNLQQLGNDMFKGCYSIQNISYMFDSVTRLHYIPDNFLSDVENQTIYARLFLWDGEDVDCNENWSFESSAGYEYGTDEFIKRQMDAVGAFGGEFPLNFYREYYPEETQDILDYYNNLTIDDVYIHLGKNMFNNTCTLKEISFAYFYACYNIRTDYSSTHCIRDLYRGEAPPLWTMAGEYTSSSTNGIFGTEAGTISSTYTDSSGQLHTSTTIYEHSYDNYEDIPKQLPWLDPLN